MVTPGTFENYDEIMKNSSIIGKLASMCEGFFYLLSAGNMAINGFISETGD